MTKPLSVEERLGVGDLLMAAAWANDSGNIDAFLALFSEDAIVQHGSGERQPARDFVTETLSRPGRKGRQHYVQTISTTAEPEGVRAKSYWMAWQWLESTGEKKLHALGYYDDLCVKTGGRWLLRERRMYRCSDQTPLPPW
jgi:hypothetical protein